MTSSLSTRHASCTVRDLIALARPRYWPVSLMPYGIGLMLATHRMVPPMADLPQTLLGALVAGPLIWLAVCAINDAHDVAGDAVNPRKAAQPVAGGRMSPDAARTAGCAGAVFAVAVATQVGTAFTVGTIGTLALGWAYSAPPLRLKARPGLDVTVNALVVGALGMLGGWTVVHPVTGFPWAIGVQGFLVAAALYIPTTVADHDADAAAGYMTLAVRLGVRQAYLLGCACWVAAAFLCVVLAATGTILPRTLLPLEVVMVPLLVRAYPRAVGPDATFRGITVLAALFLVPCGAFALTYTGAL